MANPKQSEIIQQGAVVWNGWRKENPSATIDLANAYLQGAPLANADFSGADLQGANLFDADLKGANLDNANLAGADLVDVDFTNATLHGAVLARAKLDGANLTNANLTKADLWRATLVETNLTNANLQGASLKGANLLETHFTNANLTNANLQYAILVETHLEGATLSGCKLYGLAAWELTGVPAKQSNLIITADGKAMVTVDDLQVAQFIHLLLNNQNIRNVIDTVTSKAVLILGRFTDERKTILDALHAELRKRDYLPILFDFSGPESRDITETVSLLAHMARFVIADITDAKSIPQELQAFVPNLPSVPVQPVLLASQTEYGMFEHFKRYPWVLPTYYYQSVKDVISWLPERILNPLEAKVKELTGQQ